MCKKFYDRESVGKSYFSTENTFNSIVSLNLSYFIDSIINISLKASGLCKKKTHHLRKSTKTVTKDANNSKALVLQTEIE